MDDRLGNAFLAQQSDVMDAVQRMRKKAKGTGASEINDEQRSKPKTSRTRRLWSWARQTHKSCMCLPTTLS